VTVIADILFAIGAGLFLYGARKRLTAARFGARDSPIRRKAIERAQSVMKAGAGVALYGAIALFIGWAAP